MSDDHRPSIEDLVARPDQVRATLLNLLGGMSAPRCSLLAQTHSVEDCEHYRREHVTFQSEPGERVSAWLLVPQGRSAPTAAVICPHGHGGRFDLGKNGVIGSDDPDVPRFGLDLGHHLARRGFVVLAPDARGFGQRAVPQLGATSAGERYLAMTQVLLSGSLAGRMTWDLIRACDYLATRSEVDPRRIGCAGFSMGAGQSLFVAAVEPRIAAVACVCGLSSLTAFILNRLEHCFFYYVPGLLKHLEIGPISALVAPRPQLVINGRRDASLPLEGLAATADFVASVYAGLGATDRFHVQLDDCDHRVTPESRETVCRWMSCWLG